MALARSSGMPLSPWTLRASSSSSAAHVEGPTTPRRQVACRLEAAHAGVSDGPAVADERQAKRALHARHVGAAVTLRYLAPLRWRHRTAGLWPDQRDHVADRIARHVDHVGLIAAAAAIVIAVGAFKRGDVPVAF